MYRLKSFFLSLGRKIIKFSNHFDQGPLYSEDSPTTFVIGATQILNVIRFSDRKFLRVYTWPHPKQDPMHDAAIQEAQKAGIPIVQSKAPVPGRMTYSNLFSTCLELEKWEDRILPGSHVVLVMPSLFQNAGSIIRSALAFGIHDIAIINDMGFDTFHPNLLRTSMGTRLEVRVEVFSSIEEYISRFPDNHRYAFMLNDHAVRLGEVEIQRPFSFLFGNETRGLPEEYAEFCTSVFIEQSDELDSLNLSVAAGITLYTLSKKGAAGITAEDFPSR